MPRISTFYGIAIYMYVGREHPPPHFHAIYGEFEAQVGLDGALLNGSLPKRASALVAEWANTHMAELEANWRRALAHEQLSTIEPLP
jgi:hypothetical protein